MKKILLLGGVFWLSLFATSCSNDNDVETPTSNGGQQVSIKANIADGKDLRVVYEDNDGSSMKATWSKNEKFMMYQGTSSAGEEFSNSAENKNTFNGTAPTGSGKYYGVYGNNITITTITNTKDGLIATVDISSQTGTAAENGITEFMVAKSEDLKSEFKFEHQLIVLKLTLTFPEDVKGKVSRVTLSGLCHRGNFYFNLEKPCFADDFEKNKNITATNGSEGFTITNHKITAYVAVFPQEVQEKEVTIKAETDNGLYYYIIQNSKDLYSSRGKVVPVEVSLTKVEESPVVDLGLPSGTLWATMNVGSVSPEDYGDYYAWGETEIKNKYSWDSYMCTQEQCADENNDPLYNYTAKIGLGLDTVYIAGTKYDVAHVKWGGNWKMPTNEQMQELKNNCTMEKKENYNGSGKNGWLFTSKIEGYTSNSIFFPAAGMFEGTNVNSYNNICFYWTDKPSRGYQQADCYNSYVGTQGSSTYRSNGCSVRPVQNSLKSGTTSLEKADDSEYNLKN